jgi:hypothetical protein
MRKKLEGEAQEHATLNGIYVQLVSFQAATTNTCSVSMAYPFDSTAYYKERTKSCNKYQSNDRCIHNKNKISILVWDTVSFFLRAEPHDLTTVLLARILQLTTNMNMDVLKQINCLKELTIHKDYQNTSLLFLSQFHVLSKYWHYLWVH